MGIKYFNDGLCLKMDYKIILDINNFGPIKNAKLNIKKLNIIAGTNGSGKSTSSKLLYNFLLASSNKGDYLANNSIYNHFESVFIKTYSSINPSEDYNLIEELLNLRNDLNLKDNLFNESLKEKINSLKEIIDNSQVAEKEKLIEELEDIENLIEVNKNEDKKYFNVTNVLLNSEFNFSELQDYQNANVCIYGNINHCKFSHKINFDTTQIGATISKGYMKCFNFDEVVYIESPSIFELDNNRIPYHIKHLKELVSSQKDDIDVYDNEYYQNIEKFQEKLNNLLEGELYYNPQKRDFMFKQGTGGEYSLKNTASGIKQIGIIQILLKNRSLKENSFLFIDEPEVNLHPEWQVKLAEILILMVKELNIYLYINSHSPQFIEALEVFSGKYNISEDTTFYLSEKSDLEKYSFKTIPREDLETLYDNLGKPYDKIDEIRLENTFNGIY